MSLERIPIISKKAIFTVEENPDSTGICFIHKHHGRKRVLAMLIDHQGNYFDFVMMDHKGIDVTSFNPETVLMLKCGKPAPLESEQQMEIDTPFRQLIVRPLYADERPAGVIVAAEKVIFLHRFSFAEKQKTDSVLCLPNDLASFLFPSFYIFMSEPPIPFGVGGLLVNNHNNLIFAFSFRC